MTFPVTISNIISQEVGILRSVPFLVLEGARPLMLSYSFSNFRPEK
jgi:hypothetical protein